MLCCNIFHNQSPLPAAFAMDLALYGLAAWVSVTWHASPVARVGILTAEVGRALVHICAPVDGNRFAGDEGGIFGEEEPHYARDVSWLLEPSQRRVIDPHLSDLIHCRPAKRGFPGELACLHRCCHVAGADAIDRDAEFRKLTGHCLSEPDDAEFR